MKGQTVHIYTPVNIDLSKYHNAGSKFYEDLLQCLPCIVFTPQRILTDVQSYNAATAVAQTRSDKYTGCYSTISLERSRKLTKVGSMHGRGSNQTRFDFCMVKLVREWVCNKIKRRRRHLITLESVISLVRLFTIFPTYIYI